MDNGQIENNVGGSVPHTRRGTDPNLVRSRLIESIIERDGILIMADRVNPIGYTWDSPEDAENSTNWTARKRRGATILCVSLCLFPRSRMARKTGTRNCPIEFKSSF
jgi:hypothetical protein